MHVAHRNKKYQDVPEEMYKRVVGGMLLQAKRFNEKREKLLEKRVLTEDKKTRQRELAGTEK